MKREARLCALLAGVLLLSVCAEAGGPIAVGGPTFGVEGKPFTWDPARMPIKYRVDPGPLSTNAGRTVFDNAAGLARVRDMFAVWENVPTSTISFANDGVLLPSGAYAGGDVTTVAQFDAVEGSCNAGVQSPIVFDADGSIFKQLIGDPLVIGFAGPCQMGNDGFIKTGEAVLNGIFQDGKVDPATDNFELSIDEFDSAFIHEFGHFSGLDHSQINLECLNPCSGDEAAGLPTMWPILVTPEMKTLAPDDIAWISKLYPTADYGQHYGTIKGRILFSDGVSQVQGVNVIARDVNTPKRIAVSVVSGFLFTANPGQSVTANYLPCSPVDKCRHGFLGYNVDGDKQGSRDPALIGYYEIAVPPGTYTVEVEAVSSEFSGGSSVGPVSPPFAWPVDVSNCMGLCGPEFWNLGESWQDDLNLNDSVSVAPGQTISDTDIILDYTDPRFDEFEEPAALLHWRSAPPWVREPGGREVRA